MPKFQVTRSKVINAPAEKIYAVLSDYNHWRPWSPWLITEPEATVNVVEGGKEYSWEGERTGSGNMKIIAEKENETIHMDLTFLKPWKSHSKTDFKMEPVEGGTKVTWNMDSSLPFFMFWMTGQMKTLIGMDYDRGLVMLKEFVEEGKVYSQLEFIGENEFPGCKYIGIPTECSMDQVGPKMQEDFKKMWEFMGDKMDMISGIPFSIYHKWNMRKKSVSYTVGVPVKSIPEGLPSGFNSGEIPKTKLYTLRHKGKYDHLGNAWSTMSSMVRSKSMKKKFKRGIHPFETYVNDPSDTAPNDLITDINFAMKD